LKKLIFVFDGVDEPSKYKIKQKRNYSRIHSVKRMNDKIFNPSQDDIVRRFLDKYSPYPVELMTYTQFLIKSSEKYDNLEIKFSLNEADIEIAKIAKNENG